jgi:anhydro-N-acetylmuramic acid kinase
MKKSTIHTVIGLMSGTSLDGVDAALVRTDGETGIERLDFITIPYDAEMQDSIRRCLGRRADDDGFVARTEIGVTRAHAAAVDWLLSKAGLSPQDIDLLGFHGQTICHDPAHKFTWQIGNGAMLARLTGIDVVNDFRSADVAAGGQGAPLIPLYHAALAAQLPKPVSILNIGGVANVTYIGADGEILAFDTGPGNALINDWVKKHLNREYDENGMLARQGHVNGNILGDWLAHPFFAKQPPKSLDRDAWNIDHIINSTAADGAAMLSAFTVQAIAKACDHFPAPVKNWYVTGGGRHNAVLMENLRAALEVPVEPVEKLGWNGDALEAEGFAWLAVRSVRGLSLSIPATTGVPVPQTGGRFYAAVRES